MFTVNSLRNRVKREGSYLSPSCFTSFNKNRPGLREERDEALDRKGEDWLTSVEWIERWGIDNLSCWGSALFTVFEREYHLWFSSNSAWPSERVFEGEGVKESSGKKRWERDRPAICLLLIFLLLFWQWNPGEVKFRQWNSFSSQSRSLIFRLSYRSRRGVKERDSK